MRLALRFGVVRHANDMSYPTITNSFAPTVKNQAFVAVSCAKRILCPCVIPISLMVHTLKAIYSSLRFRWHNLTVEGLAYTFGFCLLYIFSSIFHAVIEKCCRTSLFILSMQFFTLGTENPETWLMSRYDSPVMFRLSHINTDRGGLLCLTCCLIE